MGQRAHVLRSIKRFEPRAFVAAHDVYMWLCGGGSNRAGMLIRADEWEQAVADGSACWACRKRLADRVARGNPSTWHPRDGSGRFHR